MSNLNQPTGAINRAAGGYEDMHREVDWLAPADTPIMELMMVRSPTHERIKLAPKCIALNVPYGRKHVGNRCRDLADHGLMSRPKRGVYQATDLGERFVNGELRVEDLRNESR